MTSLLPCCSVLRIPFDFRDGGGYVPKLFLVIGHREDCAVAFKATSKLKRYGEKPHLCTGIVFISGTGSEPFPVDTVIDPSNAFAIPHRDIETQQEQGAIRVWTAEDQTSLSATRFPPQPIFQSALANTGPDQEV